MQLRQEVSLKQVQTLSPQFLLSQRLLQLTSLELRTEIVQELSENPALEMEEIPTCPYCNTPMTGNRCDNCGKKRNIEIDETEQFIQQRIMEYDKDEAAYEGPIDENSDRPSFLDFHHEDGTFHDLLMSNFYSSSYPQRHRILGEYLIYAVNEDGFLNIDMQQFREDFISREYEVTEDEVKQMIKVIQTLDPPGIGARNPREALLIQIDNLETEGVSNPIAKAMISDHFEDLGKNRLQKIATALDTGMSDVNRALDFIRRNLTPYPGRVLIQKHPESIFLPKPSIAIKYDGKSLSYEILEMNDFRLKINNYYLEMYKKNKDHDDDTSVDEIRHVREYFKRAKFFMDSVNSRRTTLEKIAAALVEEQREFFLSGMLHFNSEITQTRLAEKIGLHESTVSRAMSRKYVLIPTGEVLSFDFFFDASLRPKEYIRNFILNESPENPLSDSEIQQLLEAKGIPMARRTVAKYREEMRIASSYDRKRIKDRRMS